MKYSLYYADINRCVKRSHWNIVLVLLAVVIAFVLLTRGRGSRAVPLDTFKPASPGVLKAGEETKYLAFQIFTRFTPDPKDAQALSSGMREPLVPGTAALGNYVEDIKQRIGSVGDRRRRLAVMLGPLCFDQSDAEITRFVEKAFNLALEANVAVGFHIDDSMFWRSRKDLWSNPNNVEALDWDGTPNTSRCLNWSKNPTSAPPQMCFNSKAIQREVQLRSAVIGKAIQAGVNRLQQLKKTELFAGVILGWETMIGQDFETGRYSGYRALLNRGFSREHPPQDMNVELEKVVQEFIELWTTGIAEAGVAPRQIYSHTAFLSRRAFNLNDSKEVTYMQHNKAMAYSQHNHFAWVAFGKHHRPGFSTYPQPGLFEDIYELVEKHQQIGWASCEGTNMQPGTGPGQTGMNMETYLAKMFNHGATLTTLFSWGIGGERMKNMSYRLCTEGEEELKAYRKFLKGEPLIESRTTMGRMERLPLKIQKIQKELSAWLQKTGNKGAAKLMQEMAEQMKARNWDAVEQTADSILQLMDGGAPAPTSPGNASAQSPTDSAETAHQRVAAKIGRVKEGVHAWAASGHDPSAILRTMQEKVGPLIEAGKFIEAEPELDRVLEQLKQEGKSSESPTTPTEAAHHAVQDITEEVREKLAHNIGCSFLLFRTKVLGELKMTREQKEKLDQYLRTLLPEAMQVLQRSNGGRGKYNQKTHEEMAAALKEILNEDQRTRLHQLELQKDLLFGPAWNMKELQITDEQQRQFMAPTQETQRKTRALMEEIHKGANPDEIRPKALQLRLDLEVQLEALLTDAQKTKWKEMLGQPVDPSVLYGGVSSR